MNKIATGARQLPTHHITILLPWHDGDAWKVRLIEEEFLKRMWEAER